LLFGPSFFFGLFGIVVAFLATPLAAFFFFEMPVCPMGVTAHAQLSTKRILDADTFLAPGGPFLTPR
jgi:hypothetical protein